MSWSDAARRAALEVRKRRKLYHGGPGAMRGEFIKADSTAYATTSLKIARSYARRQNRGAVFEIQAPFIPRDVRRYRKSKQMTFGAARYRNYTLPREVKLFGTPGVESKQSLRILGRVPTLRGRASRGR